MDTLVRSTTQIKGGNKTPLFANRYRIRKLLGKGGMAEVYEAFDTKLKRNVAIKILRAEYAADTSFADRFITEAQAAAQLSNHRVVSVFDSDWDDGKYYIVMELVRGITLKRALRDRLIAGNLPSPADDAVLVQKICLALQEVHAAGIVHRDIKSSNIMLVWKGSAQPPFSDKDLDIKLMDFGIAQAGSWGEKSSHIIGTPQYMSPEMIEGDTTTPASDIYSLGIVMYEMATGLLPFESGSTEQIVNAQLFDHPIDPWVFNAKIDIEFGTIIQKAMQKCASDRYQNTTELYDVLTEYCATPSHSYSSSNPPKWWALACVEGPSSLRGALYKIDRLQLVGRDEKCNICLPLPAVSRKHMLCIPAGEYCVIEDLGSENGIYVDGERVCGRALCKPGAIISIGDLTFRVGAQR